MIKKNLILAAAIAGCLILMGVGAGQNEAGQLEDVQSSTEQLLNQDTEEAVTSEKISPEKTPSKTDKEEKSIPTLLPEKPQASDSQSQESVDTSNHSANSNDFEKIISKGKIRDYGGTVLVGDTGFELYNFIPSAAKKYSRVINEIGKALEDSVSIYSMVVPTSVGITLPDNKVKAINSSNQKKSINYMYKKLSDKITPVSIYDTLMEHRTEYIYYRTDHHWTGKGAYYAYRRFCEEKGIIPNELADYEREDFGGFLGSFYTDTDGCEVLKKDKMRVFYPLDNDQIVLRYTDTNGNTHKSSVICDGTNYGTSLKYCAYIAGDNPISRIHNKNLDDGSACLVVKESFGNAMVSYLADHYEDIYVVDYRYWQGSIRELVEEKEIEDVLFVNNISMTRNTYLIGKMEQIQ